MHAKNLKYLSKILNSPLHFDRCTKIIYATDASAYSEMPLAVCELKDENDIPKLIDFARKNKTSLIPRAAGTSLAGQVVGNGIVIDVSKYMNKIIEINVEEKWVRVQCGVVLEKLNNVLKQFGLFFAPETSTSNRCCVGGMVGNNSCGSHSLVYGSVREHLLEAKVFLANGEHVTISNRMDISDLKQFKSIGLKNILDYIAKTYYNSEIQQEIKNNFPVPAVTRRNHGYALDELINDDGSVNLTSIFAGSEGTLAFATELKLNLEPLPPSHKVLLCVHFHNLEDAFCANLIILRHKPFAVELIDKNIIRAASRNISQRQNMFFVDGEPEAVLIVEFCHADEDYLQNVIIKECIDDLKQNFMGYSFPVVTGENVGRVWALRKAGLGLLTNVVGSCKPVSVIEDTAVAPEYLPQYMKEFRALLVTHGLECVFHAHIATGELHLRPILNLKKEADVKKFCVIAKEVAKLVKKYHGSLSGEHGDGRLRGAFIPLMYGEKVYDLIRQMKSVWDKDNVFNSGKIIDTPSIDSNLRYEIADEDKILETYFDFQKNAGFLSAIEQCNGAADCRKAVEFGGMMCPSYRATEDEKFTPRARANIMRTLLYHSQFNNPYAEKDIYFMLDNCLSCKACKSECPSNIDIARLKSEYLQHYYKHYGYPLSVILINLLPVLQRLGSIYPAAYNFVVGNRLSAMILKAMMGFSQKRQLPLLHNYTMRSGFKALSQYADVKDNKPVVYLFADEFSNFNDANIGVIAAKFFISLGYCVKIADLKESGRIAISKGMVKRAKKIAIRNVKRLQKYEKCVVNGKESDYVIVGIEPSAILSFRDEYPDLVSDDLENLNRKILLYDEFISQQVDKGNILPKQFTDKSANILLHGHCQQKSLIGTNATERILRLPVNYNVEIIPSGCCGMAGSFGYEKRHYELSKSIAYQTLIPAILSAPKDVLIAAVGTSCREQIRHFVPEREPLHPLEILYRALK
ncbi:MAG: FAD-binding protein [Bacteroidales bacterium]|jgi:FAD/FMN-containing dehydrogenase/Fe-S oxidoreductase|nr:FAD-binding protein [Bacteroidales bacterium]